MKVAKNMDSVFADCTDDELAFDAMFDNDNSIIDMIAGVDEAGVPITGPDFDWDSLNEAEDPIADTSDAAERDGEIKHSTDAEGAKDAKPEIGGEVGDGKEVSGKENSAESHAQDVTRDIEDAIGSNDSQQTSLESAGEGPLEDDDEAARDGEVSDTAVETESAEQSDEVAQAEKDASESSDESCKESADDLIFKIDESAPDVSSADDVSLEEGAKRCIECGCSPCKCGKSDNLTDECDAAERAGKINHSEKNKEGVSQDVIGKSILGDMDNPLVDIEDADARDGKTETPTGTEGVKTKVVGAALESSDNVDDLMKDVEDDDIESIADGDRVVPNEVREDDSSNDIDKDIKNTNESAEHFNWLDDLHEATEPKAKDIEEDDDEDIELIKNNELPDSEKDISYTYDDDELIDMVDSGKSL